MYSCFVTRIQRQIPVTQDRGARSDGVRATISGGTQIRKVLVAEKSQCAWLAANESWCFAQRHCNGWGRADLGSNPIPAA